MSDNIKNVLGVSVVIVLFMFASSASRYVDSYSRQIEPGTFRSFSATGEGKVVAVPDVARFTYSVLTQGGLNLAEIQKNNNEKSNKVMDFIKSNGVKAEDIKTEGYSVNPRYQYCQQSYLYGAPTEICPPAQIVGYEINQTVSVKIRDFSKISGIVGGVVSNGANTVSGLSFTIDDPAALQNQARAMAIAKAQTQAEAVAKAAGFKLGKLLSIDDSYYPTPYYGYDRAAGMGGDGFALNEVAPPKIEPGSQEITSNVTLRYEIQ